MKACMLSLWRSNFAIFIDYKLLKCLAWLLPVIVNDYKLVACRVLAKVRVYDHRWRQLQPIRWDEGIKAPKRLSRARTTAMSIDHYIYISSFESHLLVPQVLEFVYQLFCIKKINKEQKQGIGSLKLQFGHIL